MHSAVQAARRAAFAQSAEDKALLQFMSALEETDADGPDSGLVLNCLLLTCNSKLQMSQINANQSFLILQTFWTKFLCSLVLGGKFGWS